MRYAAGVVSFSKLSVSLPETAKVWQSLPCYGVIFVLCACTSRSEQVVSPRSNLISTLIGADVFICGDNERTSVHREFISSSESVVGKNEERRTDSRLKFPGKYLHCRKVWFCFLEFPRCTECFAVGGGCFFRVYLMDFCGEKARQSV